jgi:hypothetical protein
LPKPTAFLSHIHPEAALAKLVRSDLLDRHLLSAVDVFVSSDPATNPGGTSWLHNVEDKLRTAEVILILASPTSIERPWINVEAGAGWVRYLEARATGKEPVSVMPLCHSGLTPGQLPLPWSTFNAVEIRTIGGLQAVLDTCARAAGIRSPTPDLSALAAQVQRIELGYTFWGECNRAFAVVAGLHEELLPALKLNKTVDIDLTETQINGLQPFVAFLGNSQLLSFRRTGSTKMTNTGVFIGCQLAPLSRLAETLSDSQFDP